MAKRPKKVQGKKSKKELGLRAELRMCRNLIHVLQTNLADRRAMAEKGETLQATLADTERILNLRTGALEVMMSLKDAADKKVSGLQKDVEYHKVWSERHCQDVGRLSRELRSMENLATVFAVGIALGASPFDMMEMLAHASRAMKLELDLNEGCGAVITNAYQIQADIQVTKFKEGSFKPPSPSFDIFEIISQLGRKAPET